MSSAPLLPETGQGDRPADLPEGAESSGLKKCLKFTGLGCGGCALVVFVFVWVLQGIMYAWATNLSGCRPGSLEGFNYDGDADAKQDPAWNLMPRITLLTERRPLKWVMPFYVFPGNEASTMAGGQVGTWWRTWGPLFYTYTYEDMSSKTTIYMRKNLLRIGLSHRIARCDGKDPYVTFTEGGYWFSNRVRKMLGYNQAMTFKIYVGNDLVALAEEATGEVPSLTFRNMHNDFLGSSVLLTPSFHGTKRQWLVKNNHTMLIPYFVTNAASLLFAFHELSVDEAVAAAKEAREKDAEGKPANFLALVANNSSKLPELVATNDSARTAVAATEDDEPATAASRVQATPPVTAVVAEKAVEKKRPTEVQKEEVQKEVELEHV